MRTTRATLNVYREGDAGIAALFPLVPPALLADILVQGIEQIGGLRRFRPDDLSRQRTVLLLQLCKHHLVADLQLVVRRIGGDLVAAVEGRDIHCVERRHHLVGVDRSRLLDSMLQKDAAGIARGRMIIGRSLEPVLEGFDEFGAGRTELRLVGGLDFPLRGYRDAEGGRAERREFRTVGSDEERYVFEVRLLVVDLARQRGAVGVMPAANERLGRRRNDLVDDRAEVGGGRRIGLIERDRQTDLLGLFAGRDGDRLWEWIVRVDQSYLRVRGLRCEA